MKNLKLWLVLLPLFTIACMDESTSEQTGTSQTLKSFKKSGLGPDNPVNPYDMTGNIYSKILDTLDQNHSDLHSIEDVAIFIDSLALAYPELQGMPSGAVLSERLYEITSILNNDHALDVVLLTSTLGADAQSSLSLFIESLLLTADNPYDEVYSMIVSYEESVLDNSILSSDDKRIILTTSSIVRYSADRKRKDKDWETAVSKIAETVVGANQDIVLGLKMAITVGTCQKHNLRE